MSTEKHDESAKSLDEDPREPAGPGLLSRVGPWYTTTEAASYLRYRSSSAIRNLKATGVLTPRGRRGKTDLYHVDDLDAYVTTKGHQLADPASACCPSAHRGPDGRNLAGPRSKAVDSAGGERSRPIHPPNDPFGLGAAIAEGLAMRRHAERAAGPKGKR
jgi:hypothetical protein